MKPEVLYVVVPCYNEEEVLPETTKRLTSKLRELIASGTVSPESRILYVDDGSKDKTWALISAHHAEDALVCGLKLSRNRGHQNALLAGLMHAKDCADMAISIDADLQDDIDAIDSFLEAYYGGCDIVYGVRAKRETDSFFKRFTAERFYKLMKGLGVDVIYNHADYRLMSRRALEGLEQFDEVNLFLRGIVPLIGYKSGVVTYERHRRFAGESKYPLRKMISFALEGITSFSVKPIRLITVLGFVIFTVSLLILLYSLIVYLMGKTVMGWASTVVSIWAIGGLQLLCLGIIGEYIGKIYMETKKRPKFIIEELLK